MHIKRENNLKFLPREFILNFLTNRTEMESVSIFTLFQELLTPIKSLYSIKKIFYNIKKLEFEFTPLGLDIVEFMTKLQALTQLKIFFNLK